MRVKWRAGNPAGVHRTPSAHVLSSLNVKARMLPERMAKERGFASAVGL